MGCSEAQREKAGLPVQSDIKKLNAWEIRREVQV